MKNTKEKESNAQNNAQNNAQISDVEFIKRKQIREDLQITKDKLEKGYQQF